MPRNRWVRMSFSLRKSFLNNAGNRVTTYACRPREARAGDAAPRAPVCLRPAADESLPEETGDGIEVVGHRRRRQRRQEAASVAGGPEPRIEHGQHPAVATVPDETAQPLLQRE